MLAALLETDAVVDVVEIDATVDVINIDVAVNVLKELVVSDWLLDELDEVVDIVVVADASMVTDVDVLI